MIGSGGRGQGYGGGGANGPNVANGSPAFGSFAPGSASPFASGSNSFSFRWPAPTAAELTPKAPTPMRFGGLGSAPGSASATPTRRKARTIWGDYDRKKTLGTGAYGRVYLAVDKKTGQHVAIKRTVMPSEDGAFLNPTTLREITILKKLKGHPNIVGCVDSFASPHLTNVDA